MILGLLILLSPLTLPLACATRDPGHLAAPLLVDQADQADQVAAPLLASAPPPAAASTPPAPPLAPPATAAPLPPPSAQTRPVFFEYHEAAPLPASRQTMKPHKLAATVVELAGCEGLIYLGYLRNTSSSAVNRSQLETLLGGRPIDFFAEELVDGRQVVHLYALRELPLSASELVGLWVRDPDNMASFYPGSYRFFAGNRFEYRTHSQDIYAKYYRGPYRLAGHSLFLARAEDLWPAGLARCQDAASERFGYYRVDAGLEYEYRLFPLRLAADGRVEELFVELYYLDSLDGSRHYTSELVFKLSDNPAYAAGFGYDPLTR
ncbi:MAG TPA: hypothetical protein DD477_08885 [Spirochaetaceae bacterium]|nr:hypothetical protein [Spirochaetaceae bacterium]HBO41317.1 hypothetical protein [Spirochaetaceae bacterium]